MTARPRRAARPLAAAILAALLWIPAPEDADAVSMTNGLVIHVDDDAAPGGDGTESHPYDGLPEAVAAAHSATGAVVIRVEPGDYPLGQPLVIERSMDLRGSTEQVASDDPWPSGEPVAGTETRVFSTDPSMAQLVRVGRADGVVLSDVRIGGFVFEGPASGVEVLLTRVQGYRVVDNVFRAPAFIGLQSAASSGEVKANHFSGLQQTGALFSGGYPASPSTIVFAGNRSVRNRIGGVLLAGASVDIPELVDELDAVVRDNDLSENRTSNQAFGLRLFILRRDLGAPGDSQSTGNIHAIARGNRIVGNRFGILIDAGFPYRSVGSVCDTRVYTGTIDLELAGNTLSGSVVTPALVTFTRSFPALDPSLLPQWQYLHGATFEIADRDGTIADAWIDHPAADPFTGPCPADATNEPLGNVLVYNRVVVPEGRNF